MAKERKLSKAEEAEVLRRKGNRYATGASDKALSSPKSVGNVVKENRNPGTNVLGYGRTKERIDAVRPKGNDSDKGNGTRERLEALRATDMVSDKEYKKRKKAL